MRWGLRILFVVGLLCMSAPYSKPQVREIRVAAAADLSFAMPDLARQFEKQTRVKVSVTYGSSGNFYAQMQNGGPFDLFFSADIEYPRKLEAVGLAEPGTLYEYALGRIVIWAPVDSKLNLAMQGWQALLEPRVQKIAIANPQHAPYGRAALAALKNAGIYEQVKAKLVFGENIAQAAQFIQSGNADAGIIAMSLALSSAMRNGKCWEIPASMHPPIEQGMILLKSARDKDMARAFLEFVLSPTGKGILTKFGFSIPGTNSSSYRGLDRGSTPALVTTRS
ncbi:MAG TPA: molybdate ABC transporter substrate-binding protein [Candidatus Dormibacteraeota bacterium]|nr:molybdate ABC transporter substrate-binding protein [Candidatus Dormibacteraeota bacterium]